MIVQPLSSYAFHVRYHRANLPTKEAALGALINSAVAVGNLEQLVKNPPEGEGPDYLQASLQFAQESLAALREHVLSFE